MDGINNALAQIASWPFLDEPLWRWAIFFGAMLGIIWGWNGAIDFMK